MKKANRNVSWTPFTDNLKKEYTIVDNELEKSLDELGLFSKAHLFGLIKTKGFVLKQVMFSILIWPLLSVTSLHFFRLNTEALFSGFHQIENDEKPHNNPHDNTYEYLLLF